MEQAPPRCGRGHERGGVGPAETGRAPHTADIFTALGATLRERSLPVELLDELLSAFRQDAHVTRYTTWVELLDYCRRSANPIGRLVLRIAGCHRADLDGWSDAICTALQLTNFWQDVPLDAARGRVYLPLEKQQAHIAREDDIRSGRLTAAWRRARMSRISASRSNWRTSSATVAAAAAARLPAWQAKVRRAVVVREKHATFSVAPGQPPRPATTTAVARLFLAGDWIETDLPATIESAVKAVKSGHRAAAEAEKRLRLSG